MKATLRKMGNSQGVLLPKAIVEQLGITDALELSVENGAIVLRRPDDGTPSKAALLAALQFALDPQTDNGLAFLRSWLANDMTALRQYWPSAPTRD